MLLFPNGKSCGPSSEQTCIPFTQGDFLPSLIEIVPVVLEKEDIVFKRLPKRHVQGSKDIIRSEKITLVPGSGEL